MSREESERQTPAPEAPVLDDDQQPAIRSARTRHTRERLLDAALELFAEQGFEATTTKLIAQRAGVPNGLIYYHFGTKEKLLECLFAERTFLPELSARIASAHAHTDADAQAILIEICIEFHAALQRNEPFVRIISQEAGLRPVARQLVRQLTDQVLALLEAFLEDAQAAGKLEPLDSETVAYALLSSILLGGLFRPFSEPRPNIERLVHVLLGSSRMH